MSKKTDTILTASIFKNILTASLIKNNALNSIKAFVLYEANLLYKLIYGREPNYEEGDELCICGGDLVRDVCIHPADMDFTDIQVSQIVVREDGTIIIRDEDSEWEDKVLNFDDIVEIANVLQESYNARV